MAVAIQKTLCGGRNTDNLIESTCFYLKISRVHMFCDDDLRDPGFFRVERLSITCTRNQKVNI